MVEQHQPTLNHYRLASWIAALPIAYFAIAALVYNSFLSAAGPHYDRTDHVVFWFVVALHHVAAVTACFLLGRRLGASTRTAATFSIVGVVLLGLASLAVLVSSADYA